MGKRHKTRKTVAKRVRRTARGKIITSRGGKSHLQGHKSRKRKRHLRKRVRVSPALEQVFRLAIGK